MAKDTGTVLENYEKRGLLDTVKGRFSAEDRRRVGERYAHDFYLAGLQYSGSIDYAKPRVDNSNKGVSDFMLDARDRWAKAARAIPSDFFAVVEYVCCFDKPIKGKGKTKQQRLYGRYMLLCDLCRGLDALAVHYLSSKKTKTADTSASYDMAAQ